LGGNIQDACLLIQQFFEKKFGDQVEIHPGPEERCTEGASTYAAIRKLLYVDLPLKAKGTLTYLFMMSHGEMVSYDNQFLSQDLEFITSDATDSTKTENSLSIGIELMNWLSKLSAGSTVLAFVDTCNSGAVNSLALKMQEGAKDFLGLRLGVMVSALNNQGTYAAAFTRSLLKFWQAPACPQTTSGLKVEDWLYQQMVQSVGQLKGNDGYPVTVVPLAGSLCLGQLGVQGQLLFLYQGAARNVIWTVSDIDRPSTLFPPIHTSDEAYTFSVVPPGHYRLHAQTADGHTRDFGPYDLVSESTVPVFLSFPNNKPEAVKAMISWLDHAKFKGLNEAEISKVDAAAQYVSAALSDKPATGTPYGDRPSDKGGISAAMHQAADDPQKLRALGNSLLQAGYFAEASRALVKAAQGSSDPLVASDAATDAFLAAGIAGDTKAAQGISKKYSLTLGSSGSQITDAASQAAKNMNQQNLDSLKAATAIELVTAHSHAIFMK
jgi:hypothetical protein